jgi:protein involved in polysaccharide export with SLBB domain
MPQRFETPGRLPGLLVWLFLALCAGAGGCAAVANPVADAVPVRRLPADFFPVPKAELKTIPLTMLRQKPPTEYLLDTGDILGIYIEGVLGDKNQPPPVRLAEAGNLPPALGFPLPVREDGTVPLPMIQPVQVKGLTLIQAQEKIQRAYLDPKQIIKPERPPIVTLIRPRVYRVLVVRQDTPGGTAQPGSPGIGLGAVLGPGVGAGTSVTARRGTGATIELPAYENDVLTALTRTGGLPGFDAMNEVVIQRGAATASGGASFCPPGGGPSAGTEVVRIPLRTRGGEPPPIKPDDVILKDGDIIFIEARDTQVFYTGGLLFPRQYLLPRDFDIRAADAVMLAGGPIINGLQTQNNLSGALVTSGLGSPSPSLLTVLRRTQHYGQVAIRVDLNRALRDPRENIAIQPGDVLILQETVGEALTRYLTTVFRLNFVWTWANHRDFLGTETGNLP